MEFKFNKIDTDIRLKLQEKTRSDKVQSNDNIRLKKDIKEHDNKEEQLFEKKAEKNVFVIEAIKKDKKTLVVDVEKIGKLDEETSKGVTLDIKK